MISLRTRLAALSALLSGIAIVLLALFVESYVRETLIESVDLKLAAPLDRILRDLHPRVNVDSLERRMDELFDEKLETGQRLVLLRDDFEDQNLLTLPAKSDWLSQVPEFFWRGDPEELDRLGRLPSRPLPPGESDVDAFLSELLAGEIDGKGKGKGKGRGFIPSGAFDEADFEPKFLTMPIDGHAFRVVISRSRGYSVMNGVPLSQAEAELRRLRRSYLLGMPLALICIAGAGWLVADRALQPVKNISRTAQRITASGLDERIPEASHLDAEFSELTKVLNHMIERLEKSFLQANRFSADVSHELKTPLAIIQGKIDTALRAEGLGSEAEAELLTVQGEVHRLKSITTSLMTLAQADAGQLSSRRREPVSLSAELEAICEDTEILCEAHELAFRSDIQSNVTRLTNRVLFHQAVQNLVSNAVKYNCADGQVEIKMTASKRQVLIRVRNTGPGIPEVDQAQIFHRFHRADRSRSRQIDGFGLGLNLAIEIFRSLGGDLRLVSSDSDWTEFEGRLEILENLS